MKQARVVSDAERRARLVLRHHLQLPTDSVTLAAASVVGFHSTDAASVYLAARARVREFEVVDVEAALYEQRTLARVLGMRRTMFVVPVEYVPIVYAACTRAIAQRERTRTARFIEEGGLAADGARWLARVEGATLALLRDKGEATAVELGRELPNLRKKVAVGEGKKWVGEIGISTRVLFLLAADGKIVRARPRGTWLSTQYRWAPADAWFGRALDEIDEGTARAELVRLWLGSFGPGTADDIAWWAGWTKGQTATALRAAEAVEVGLEGGRGYLLPGDLDVAPRPEPSAVLLPALDATVMGWFERGWYLGPHRSALFDRNGNAGPTVWWDGRVVGGWAQRPDGRIAVNVREELGAAPRRAIDREAEALADWLGDVRIVPRFRTPVERELSVSSP